MGLLPSSEGSEIMFDGTKVSESLPTRVTGARFLPAARRSALSCVGLLNSGPEMPGGG